VLQYFLLLFRRVNYKMSADIEKLAVFDDRIVQTRPRYAVEKGALSLTNSPFQAISQTQSQHTYNLYVPSENVYVSRDLEWSSTVYLALSVRLSDTAGEYPVGEPLFELGVDGSLAAFPLNALCATMTATINDTTVTINSQDVLTEVLRLTDYRGNRLQRTCPTMLDKYQRNADALNAQNDTCSGYTNMAHDYGEVPNGAFYNVAFTGPTGQPLTANNAAAYVAGGLTVATNEFGIPVSTAQIDGSVNGLYTVYLKVRSTEKLVLSPFIFAEEYSSDTGLFGINNIQLVMNMRDPNRAMRLRNKYSGSTAKEFYGGGSGGPSTYLPPVSYNTTVGSGAFSDSVINCQFLTPSLDIPLPPKSVVPYVEFPRYITAPQNVIMSSGASQQLQSQTITLPQIPDLLVIYVKAVADPATVAIDRSLDPSYPQYGSAYLPIQTSQNGVRTTQPLSINFDNFSGLLSSQSAEQLYHMSVKNGLDIDFNTWAGFGRGQSQASVPQVLATGSGATPGSPMIPTVGGFLVLKPSVDLTLQSGQAPSLVGNFTLQFNLQVTNTFPFAVQPQIYVITVNSGFFESIRGSSRIIKGVLSEQDIIAAPLAPTGTRMSLARMIGGATLGLANRLGLVKSHSGSERGEKREHKEERENGRQMGRASHAVGRGLQSRLM